MEIDEFLSPVSEEAPCGADLCYEPPFLEMRRASEGSKEKRAGDEVIPAEPPDWKRVRTLALELLGQTRDLRVASLLTQALLVLEGFRGLAAGLRLCLGLVETYWDSVHPELDEGDAIFRRNALLDLAGREGFLETLLDVPFVKGRAGAFCLRDVKILSGELPPSEGDDPPQAELLGAALTELGDEAAAELLSSLEACIEGTEALESAFAERAGVQDAPELEPLAAFLRQIRNAVAEATGASVADPEEEAQTEHGGGAGPGVPGRISSPDDVRRQLRLICEYYRRSEPSSPIPLLLERAASLVNKSFLEIVQDLAPSGIHEAQGFAPSREDGSEG
jgi:type VI secretion system protein ImpA